MACTSSGFAMFLLGWEVVGGGGEGGIELLRVMPGWLLYVQLVIRDKTRKAGVLPPPLGLVSFFSGHSSRRNSLVSCRLLRPIFCESPFLCPIS